MVSRKIKTKNKSSNFQQKNRNLQRDEKAEQSLVKVLKIDPNSMEYLYALTEFYLKRKKFQKAKDMVQQMIAKHPNEPIGKELLGIIEKNLQKEN